MKSENMILIRLHCNNTDGSVMIVLRLAESLKKKNLCVIYLGE